MTLLEDLSVATLTGEVDLSTTELLDDACRAVLVRGLPAWINASRLTFVDLSGLVS